jgi:plasmid maintenance system antidote protein VapI
MAKKSNGLETLLDTFQERFGIKNDAALSRMLKVAPPVVSKWRTGRLELGASGILKLHETFGMPVKEIRELAAA